MQERIVSLLFCIGGKSSAGLAAVLLVSGCGGGGAAPDDTVDPAAAYLLNVAKSGSGRIHSEPAGIACGDTCSASYMAGTAVKLIAVAGPNYIFKGWSGSCSGTLTSCTVSVSTARNVAVNFESAAAAPASIDAVI